ncbi:Serine/threonine-protein kinase nak1 [Escovopsis weberi]|uniref:non-specific serine/threonine protein kinase n=1 Tax=Escovopsis weberi TaxID=150374 RepID=A0A0M8N1C9_ESCWE|nr:Serine/threonine-protein kinase nak1 [Escovopsis weberi]
MSLQVRWPGISVTKQKALEDARKMQNAVDETCNKAGRDSPQYQLQELIGKGSFGRVYKATSTKDGRLVAVKIIDIEEGDTVNPKLADTYGDLLKEIKALQRLSESGAKNINHVIEALPVGQSMWMVTEYCAGGSVATLMRPTAPGGLLEKWIIPIVREVAEAIHWVHDQGIIHRDLKCANVLVTEDGNVQLCDFGVAGVIETKFDKRTTFIGTPHWMAPELFDQEASYGVEVDIWAFGAMVYEIASGLPPNVTAGIDFSSLGAHLRHHTPRLEGDQYSAGLQDIVAYCLQHDARLRPTIEDVQQHQYIFNTEKDYPTSSLTQLVRTFKLWEAQGGDRRSLFSAGGAQGLAELSAAVTSDDWNFSTTAAFDQQVLNNNGGAQDVFDVYGSALGFEQESYEETSRPPAPKPRRRQAPYQPSVKAPLEKIFDPNTRSTYEENSRAYYSRPWLAPGCDLPLRSDNGATQDVNVRESLIDLDASLNGCELSQFVDLDTIRPRDSLVPHSDYDLDDAHYIKASVDEAADPKSNNRRTQDWKFPSFASEPVNPQTFRFPFTDDVAAPEPPRGLTRHQTEPYQPSSGFTDLAPPDALDNRASTGSLIDLDMSMSFPDCSTDFTRPSTSHSDAGSISGSELGGADPFQLEKHASLYVLNPTNREPSIYVSDDSDFAHVLADLPDMSLEPEHPPSSSSATAVTTAAAAQPAAAQSRPYSLSDFADMDPEILPEPLSAQPPPPLHHSASFPEPLQQPQPPRNYAHAQATSQPQLPYLPQAQSRPSFEQVGAALPPLPAAPMPKVLLGEGSTEDIRMELRRMAMSLGDHLSHINSYLAGLPVRGGNTGMHSSDAPTGEAM